MKISLCLTSSFIHLPRRKHVSYLNDIILFIIVSWVIILASVVPTKCASNQQQHGVRTNYALQKDQWHCNLPWAYDAIITLTVIHPYAHTHTHSAMSKDWGGMGFCGHINPIKKPLPLRAFFRCSTVCWCTPASKRTYTQPVHNRHIYKHHRIFFLN